MRVGFIHGVMNHDNEAILQVETIDYGPYGFMDAYDPVYLVQ